ncbi:hypothetical protein [Cupriavidus pampae]|uniref:DUF2746 domain-containing protein n=1 Tax=Cupriavidus pampae TaxID=659251 RepID=A0ABM8XNE0_9BURK|nr:hypothetical protein [Cupriavidus pampae]CAG9181776.1 hypothetical protein LMG32289_04924 [Cupriavidus pampae]
MTRCGDGGRMRRIAIVKESEVVDIQHWSMLGGVAVATVSGVFYILNFVLTRMDKKVDLVIAVMNHGFDHVNKRFDLVDQRFEDVDKRFEQVDKRFEQVDKHLERLETRIDRLDVRMERVELQVRGIDTRLQRVELRIGEQPSVIAPPRHGC